MFIIVLGQHVSSLIKSSSGPSKIQILTYSRIRPLYTGYKRPEFFVIKIRLNTGDKSLKVRQEYNINIKKISLTKRNISA